MALPYSNDLRIRIIKLVEGGMEQKQVAALLSVHENTVCNICKRHRQTGSIEPKQHIRRGKVSKIDDQKLIEIYTQNPDTFQYEAAAMLGVAQSAISNRLKKLGITKKKEFNLRRGRFGKARIFS